MVSATKLFEIEERQIGTTNSKALYVRDKRKKQIELITIKLSGNEIATIDCNMQLFDSQ